MAPGSAAHRRRDAALRPGHEIIIGKLTWDRILAAHFARALPRSSPSIERGRREDRVPAGTRGPLCEVVVNKIAQRHTGEAKTSGLPCAVVLRLMSRSPRGAMHYCPRRLADG